MKRAFLFFAISQFASSSFAANPTSASAGKDIGIIESAQSIVKTFTASNGTSEALTVFKDTTSKISWQLENKNKNGVTSSKIQKLRDGSELVENYAPDGKVVSRMQTDPNGKTKIENL
jgi:hypothetical protein